MSYLFKMFGFDNADEALQSLLGVYYAKGGAVLSILGAVAATLTGLLEEVYQPVSALLLVVAGILFDWAVATYGALRTKTYSTDKAKRVVATLAVHVTLLALLYRAESSLVADLGEQAVRLFAAFRVLLTNYIFFVSVLSAVSNAGRLGLIKAKVVVFISQHIDTMKEQFTKK